MIPDFLGDVRKRLEGLIGKRAIVTTIPAPYVGKVLSVTKGTVDIEAADGEATTVALAHVVAVRKSAR